MSYVIAWSETLDTLHALCRARMLDVRNEDVRRSLDSLEDFVTNHAEEIDESLDLPETRGEWGLSDPLSAPPGDPSHPVHAIRLLGRFLMAQDDLAPHEEASLCEIRDFLGLHAQRLIGEIAVHRTPGGP